MSAAVAPPVLIRKLQCFSETCAPPRVRPRQPAASISSHAFMRPGGLRNVEPPVRARTGCVASRARADLGHARGDRRRRRRGRARKRARTTTPPARQRGVPVAEARAARAGSRTSSPERVTISAQSRHGGDVAAVGAGVHRHRAADGAGNAGQEFQPGEPGRGRVFRDRHVERRGAGDDAVALAPRSRRSRARGAPPRPARRRRARSGWRRRRSRVTGNLRRQRRAGTRRGRRRRPAAPAPPPARRRGTRSTAPAAHPPARRPRSGGSRSSDGGRRLGGHHAPRPRVRAAARLQRRELARQRRRPLRDVAGAEAHHEIAGPRDRVHHLGQMLRAGQRHHAAMPARAQTLPPARRGSRRRSAASPAA